MILYNKQNEETDSITFSNIRKDSSISKKDFDFTPPKGTQIHEVKDVGSRMNPKNSAPKRQKISATFTGTTSSLKDHQKKSPTTPIPSPDNI